MPLYVVYGDPFLVRREVRVLLSLAGPEDAWTANVHRLQADEADPEQVQGLCLSVPFLAEGRVVVIEGLLSRFNPDRRDARPRSLGAWESLPTLAEQMPPTSHLVLADGDVARENPLLKALKGKADIKHLPTPRGEALARWVKQTASEKGVALSPGALQLLLQLVGNDLWALDNELEKLSLYVGEGTVTERQVNTLVPQSREASVFTAIDALMSGRLAQGLRLLEQLRREGMTFGTFVALMSRQLRLVAQARELVEKGASPEEIGRELRIPHSFVVRRVTEQARRHTLPGLASLFRALVEADLAVKTGRTGEDTALEVLATRFARR